MEAAQPAAKRARTEEDAAAATSDGFAALFEPGTDAAHIEKFHTSKRVKIEFRGKEENFRFDRVRTAEDLEMTICSALCIPDPESERVVLKWVADEAAPAGAPTTEQVPRFEASIPPDFDLEDLAELAQVAAQAGGYEKIQELLESYRPRYGNRTDTWKAFAINEEWQALAEDAVYARLEKRARATDNHLEVQWLQQPAWGPCEWLMLHKRKDGSWSNAINPAVSICLKQRISSEKVQPLDEAQLDSVRLVLLSPGGKDVTGEAGTKAENLRVGEVTRGESGTASLTYPELGIREASEKFPSKLGMRQGKKTQRGARGWYHLAVHVQGLGVSLLWDDKTQQPCDLVVKHFRNKWGENPGEPKRGPYADHTACRCGSHLEWAEDASGGAWQLRCGGWRPGDRSTAGR
jgi:hypothetical protein